MIEHVEDDSDQWEVLTGLLAIICDVDPDKICHVALAITTHDETMPFGHRSKIITSLDLNNIRMFMDRCIHDVAS